MQSFDHDEEFYRRLKHDFRMYVLLISNKIHLSQDSILHIVCNFDGYKRHKTVKYCQYTSHIVVKFEDVYYALEAIARLNLMTWGVTATLLDDMLRDWFTYELKTCPGTPYSLTVVDIIGSPPFNLNFLTSNILSSIFQDFGETYILPYTAALNEHHVQVLFPSMTEALAACVAFGEWYYMDDKADLFFHRVRINPSNKEEKLIKDCGGTPSEALRLDYFVNFKQKPKTERSKVPCTQEKRSKTKVLQNKRVQKLRKQAIPPAHCPDFRQANIFAHRTPILYFPIIATNPCNILPPSNNQFNVEFPTEMLNLQPTFPAQNVLIANNSEPLRTKNSERRNAEQIFESTKSKNGYVNDSKKNTRTSQTQVRGQIVTRIFERRN